MNYARSACLCSTLLLKAPTLISPVGTSGSIGTDGVSGSVSIKLKLFAPFASVVSPQISSSSFSSSSKSAALNCPASSPFISFSI